MSRALPARHGMTPREHEIMDAIEAGDSRAAVAEAMGLSRNYIDAVATRCSGSWSENQRFDAMVRTGTIELARACARSGGRFA